jgi:predicted permease
VSLPSAVYSDRPKRLAFWDEFESRLAALPGVRSAAIVNCPPFGCHWGSFYIAEGAPPRSADEANPVVLNRHASPSYFATRGIRLKAGRFFNAVDGRTPDGERVAIVNETFSRTFFPGVESPVGRRFRSTGDKEPWNLIVGYVADVKHYGLERPMRPGIYWPLAMSAPGTLSAAVKSEIDAESLATAARSVLRQIDPELPMFRVRTMEGALAESMALRTTYSWMLAIFAMTALMLALGGTYGVSSYLVTQRTREIGIRVALGAARGDIVRSVLHGSLITVSVGIFVGMMASLGAGTLLETLLFGVKPHDGLILTGATALLVLAAMLANVLPARRAAKVDPMISLRTE